ncbi:MAG: hypothetical protein LUD16_03680 [Lachnospiraceae bacterium]|nr:hypothetical protein [Lachnospiraceae bacterium]
MDPDFFKPLVTAYRAAGGKGGSASCTLAMHQNHAGGCFLHTHSRKEQGDHALIQKQSGFPKPGDAVKPEGKRPKFAARFQDRHLKMLLQFFGRHGAAGTGADYDCCFHEFKNPFCFLPIY